MRRLYKTFAFVSISVVLSVFYLMKHEIYCEEEMELIGGGGQSNIYKCGPDVVKLYRMGDRVKKPKLLKNRLKLMISQIPYKEDPGSLIYQRCSRNFPH